MAQSPIFKGTNFYCEAGHHIGFLNDTLHKGDINYSSKFTFFGERPAKGSPLPLRCACGAVYFSKNAIFVNLK